MRVNVKIWHQKRLEWVGYSWMQYVEGWRHAGAKSKKKGCQYHHHQDDIWRRPRRMEGWMDGWEWDGENQSLTWRLSPPPPPRLLLNSSSYSYSHTRQIQFDDTYYSTFLRAGVCVSCPTLFCWILLPLWTQKGREREKERTATLWASV